VTAEISDWQTFPQLYVNGQLVGGCDIVEEMDESGELAGVLGAERAEPEPQSAKQELKADDPQQSPPIQIER
jgi:monothiol glutaredoxin